MLTVYLSLVHIVAVMEHAFIIIVFPLNVLVVAVLFLIPNIQHALVVLALLTILLVAHVKEEAVLSRIFLRHSKKDIARGRIVT